MKYNTWREVPLRGCLKVICSKNNHNQILNQVYEFDLTNINYYTGDIIRWGRELVKNITPSYPEGNYIDITQVKFIKVKKDISKEFKKMFKQL